MLKVVGLCGPGIVRSAGSVHWADGPQPSACSDYETGRGTSSESAWEELDSDQDMQRGCRRQRS